MADTNKLVSMIALVISGLLIIAWGAIFIWLHRNDQLVLTDLQRRGAITAQDAARLTNSTWIWILAISQIIIGLALIAWGVFQYVAKVDDVVIAARKQVLGVNGTERVTTTVRTVGNGNGSRRVYVNGVDPIV